MNMNRRQFVVSATAGAFALGWGMPGTSAQAAPAAGPVEVGVWAVVHPDDTVVVRIARTEMGQGTMTGLAQLVADEMDADWSRVRAEYIPPEVNLARKRAWGDMSTGGSRGIRASVEYVRKGGAAARAMLIQAAATQWGVPVAECSAAESVVTHTPSKRTLRYGELAEAASKLPVPETVTVKDPSQWKIIGKGVKRLDTVEKLSGKMVFAIDVTLPDMLNATIAQSPVFGGKLVSFDAKAVLAMPGVRYVLPVGDNAVAVVADKFYQAKTAMAKLPIVWDEAGHGDVSSASIAKVLAEGLDAKVAGVGLRQGDVEGAFAGAAKKIEATYTTPFLNHATLEPMNADRALRRRPRGDLDPVAERRRLARRRGRSRGPAALGREGQQVQPRRRLRPARAAGLHAPGGAARQADPRPPGQADLDPGGGHAARLLPPDHPVPHDRQHGR